MKKERKQYGVIKPKSLDFMLAIMFALVSVSALLIGIWVACSKSQALATDALEYTAKAFAGSFAEANGWLVVVESVILYGAILGCCILAVFEMARKKFKALAGLMTMVVFAISFALQLSFIVVYLFSEVSGLLSVFLMVIMVCELYIAYLTGRLLYAMVIKQSAEYGKYKAEFGAPKEEEEKEVPAKPQVKEKIIIKRPKVEEQPKVVEQPKEEPKDEEDDDFDFIFTNSNDYKEYMYHDNIAKYMKEEEEKPLPKKEEPKEEKKEEKPKEPENNSNRFGGEKGNNYTFEQKLKLAKPVVREYFKEITTYFVSLGFTPALTKQGETFSYKNNKCASITTAGKNGLKLFYRLDVKDYEDSKIPVKYVGNVRKYENTPLLFVAKSELAIKRAKKLMDDVKSKLK